MIIQTKKPISTVLIKPAGPDCNMDCSYCFNLEKTSLFEASKTHRMTAEVLEETVRQVMQQTGHKVSMAWQGGEPTLMGHDKHAYSNESFKHLVRNAIHWLNDQ